MKVRSMENRTSRLSIAVVTTALVAAAIFSRADDRSKKDAYDQAVQARFSSRTELVLVPVIVTDRSGAHMSNLTKDDFTVLENGVAQKVATFEEVKATAAPMKRVAGPAGEFSNIAGVATQPRRVNIIVLDVVNTPFTDQAYARQSLIKYLAQSVNSGDLTTLLTFSRGGIHIVHDFTTDPAVLVAALKKVRGQADVMASENADAIVADTMADPAAVQSESADISAFLTHADAVSAQFQQQIAIQATLDAFDAIANAYAGVPGRKALIWMTGSFPIDLPKPGDIHAGQFMDATQRAFEKLNNANISVYPVDARGLVTLAFDRHQDTITTMQSFAEMTGGRAFYNTNDLSTAVAKAAEDSAAYYVLGYYLKSDRDKPGWRKLQVKVTRDGVHVRARAGFFVVKQDLNDDKVRASEMRTALVSPFEFTALPVIVRWTGQGSDAAGKKIVRFSVHLNANSITIDDSDKNHVSLEFLAVARDPTMKVANQVGQTVEAHLKPESVDKLRTSGMTYNNQLVVAPGDYNVRFVVRDNLNGHIGSLQVPLKVE